MATFEALTKKQKEIGEKIETIIRNFKKDPSSRKDSITYYQERLRRLDEAWSEFETTDNNIRMVEEPNLGHEYFTNNYYETIMNLVHKYKEMFESLMLKVTQTPRQKTAPSQENLDQANANTQSDEMMKLIRRQGAMMASLERLLREGFSAPDIPIATTLWTNIESMHFKICEMFDDPVQEGYNMEKFVGLEETLRRTVKSAATTTSDITTQHIPREENVQSDSLPMPKIIIPKFDGNYLKWQQFYDLFSSLVICQPISKVQKMWYLKTHLAGEASNLIKHFASTGENFDTAWSMVIDRYNNRRLLVSKLIQELVDAPNTSNNDNFKGLHDRTQECLLALNNLNIETSAWDPLLLHLLLKNLDQATRLRYEQSLSQPREVQTVKKFLEFLEKHFQSMEAIGVKNKSTNSKAKVCTSVTSPSQSEDCTMCKNGKHPLFCCKTFLQLSPAARLNFIQRQKYCCNCLKSGHSAKTCGSRSCMKCNKKHNTLLHLENSNHTLNKASAIKPQHRASEGSSKTMEEAKLNQEAASLTSAKNTNTNDYVLLSTAVVRVKTDQTEIECRALLDSGSQVNFITERLVKRLGISMHPSSVRINGIGSINTKTQHRVNVALHSRINGFSTRLEALVLSRIISPQPSQFINTEEWSLPKNLLLADPAFNRPDKIDILLGAEHYHQLLSIGQIKLNEQLPILQNTVFGWIVSGKIQADHQTNLACGVCTAEESLEASISRLWELDEVKTSDRQLSIAERNCEEHFMQHTAKNKENRFIVKIPFHQNPEALGESRGIALNRFLSLERRLQKNPEIKTQYAKFMEEYQAMGHMSKIAADEILSPHYFIPHHCVLRPESSTTKLRVVFDASAKTSSGHSLNDLMYTGPTVQSELFSILLRFRLPRFVFTTDVEKMYRQILVSPEDRQFQIIIWREDVTKPITYYKLNTVTYGTRAAPYLATRCLQQIAKDNAIRYPLASKFLQENFYVDDGLGGADSLATTINLQKQLTEIMKENGFNLRKWCANHPQLLQNIPQGDLEVNLDFESTKADSIKTLGLTWLPKEDKLCVKVNVDLIKRITKRTVTSDLARLFDPLGILSPIVVTAKIFIQELWELKLDWDQSLPESLHTKWLNFRADLEELKTLQISRHIFKGRIPETTQLHIFTDASEKAYGAAAYIRSVFKDGTIMVRLLCAKSRVAPLKRQSIPRLELCAAVLGAQLASKIKADLQFSNPVWCWTDSEIVLSWIHSTSALYNTFVANRISSIQETTRAEQWRHVGSKCNPADALSRGMTPKALKACTLWFCGPLFLHGKEEIWPPIFNSSLSIETNLERKRKIAETLIVTATSDPTFVYSINHGNSFFRLQRIVGYILRFTNHVRCQNNLRQPQISLTTVELDQSLIQIMKQVQISEFKEEINQLQRYTELKGTNKLCNLSPFLDKNGLIRVGGRLNEAPLTYDSKHQILIPYNDPISKLIFETTHIENKHCGAQTLLGLVRQRYWPLKGKIMARSTTHRCTICSRAKPALFKQIMGNLPATRVTPARPFINTGVDYCGPITVHYKVRGKRPHKAYIAVFCCFATKAVHLELVSDLTTDAFIGALKRFIGRRGHCQNLYCDNATNFVGAKNQLPELSSIIYTQEAQESIVNTCSQRGIQFNFIPPRAPHFGGLWEAAVKSAKHLLLRSAANASLTYEELETLIIEIEAILNSRPISPMSNDPNDISALTPGHFLIGEPLTAQIDAQAKAVKTSLTTRWKLVSHLKHEFWKRWSRDYLNELQYRNKWQERSKSLQPGTIVIIKEDNVPVMKWPLGRVIKIYKGNDEVVRVADVKTASGIFKRAVQYLAPLPTANDENSESHQIQNTPSSDHSEQQPSSNSDMPVLKRRKISAASTTTLLIILLALPLVFAGKVEISEFDSNIGLHFEGIGKARTSRSEWNIITYYELQPYWREMTAFKNGTAALRQLCTILTQKSSCKNVLQSLELGLADLKDENLLFTPKRNKRGAVNFIGNVANSLFGVLDSNYAEQMSNTINLIKEDENHIKNLLQNQTSIIDATLNIFKQEEGEIKEKFENLDAQVSEIIARLHENEDEQYQMKLFQTFISLSVHISMISARLHRIQAAIVAALSDSHHGKISPSLLSPSQLQSELMQVRNHLPTSLQLPVSQDNLLQLYKLMNVRGGITEQHVIFHISVPLCDPETFEIYKLHPIPALINNRLVAIVPCSEYIAINAHRDQYIVLNYNQLKTCTITNEDEFLCPQIQSKLNSDADRCLCEMALINNNTRANCNIAPSYDKTVLTQLQHNNHWMYTVRDNARITAVCGREHSQITLKGSGLLKISPDCTLKHKSMVIQGHQTYSSSLQASYTATADINNIEFPSQEEPLLRNFHVNNYTNQLKTISELQSKLHQQVIMELPSQLQHIKYHHGIISYISLVLIVGVIIILLYKRMKRQKVKLNQQQSPVPSTRQHINSSDFTTTVT